MQMTSLLYLNLYAVNLFLCGINEKEMVYFLTRSYCMTKETNLFALASRSQNNHYEDVSKLSH